VPALRDDVAGELHTPGQTTVEGVAGSLGVASGNLVKAFPVVTERRGYVVVFVRGDHRINEVKLTNALGEPFRPAREDELHAPAGYLGPPEDAPALYDVAVTPGRYVAGGNRPDHHMVVDVPAGERVDVRTVEAGDTVGGHAVTIEPAIEVGNIFKLGTRYSVPLGATYLDDSGREHPIVMGSYGIGPARVAAAAVEQFADDRGISWPRSIAPWQVELVGLGKPGTPEREAAEQVYAELLEAGLDVLFDDRDAGPGEKFTDAELLGVPLRLTLGKRSLESGVLEAQRRRGREDVEGGVPLAGAAGAVEALWHDLP
jgi:prolyl-tRNA synthetase